MQSPQFPTQDDSGFGAGLVAIPQWHEASPDSRDLTLLHLDELDLDPAICSILFRLRNVFHSSERNHLSSNDLHDLTCFILHRLLSWSPQQAEARNWQGQMTSGAIRHAVALYLLINHGPTYFSHAHLQYNLTLELKANITQSLDFLRLSHGSLTLWLLSVGVVASIDTPESHWFEHHARIIAGEQDICSWDDALGRMKGILWYNKQQTESVFRQSWEQILAMTTHNHLPEEQVLQMETQRSFC